ncbi:MAG: galactokinase, partial [SAR324 cluster bacterium]|nr:galactokinase [SAR324 cluster bacterium]
MIPQSNPRERVIEEFKNLYHTDPSYLVRAPGRVNLIGEHTDYNDGFVLPMALSQSIWIALSSQPNPEVELHSLDFEESVNVPLEEDYQKSRGWQEFLKGVLDILKQEGYSLSGWKGVAAGNVPIGAGLSSSSAFELAIARAFTSVGNWEWHPLEMAGLCQRAENEWVGMNCGIMDQTISALGQAGNALFLDCRSLETRQVRMPENLQIAVMDTGTRHELVDSAYNERRLQCEKAAAFFEVKALRDLSLEKLLSSEKEMDPVVYRRARHVVTENQRVLSFIKDLESGSPEKAGQQMNESHQSLRDDFEVSSEALDLISECARESPGCYGARMTGGGFAGCGVALVDASHVQTFLSQVLKEYFSATGETPQLYSCSPADGTTVFDY